MSESAQRSMLRPRTPRGHHRVTPVELFFDLVFVFAVTQISHALLKDFSPLTGATFADLAWSAETIAAFVISFVGSVAMWWIYFHKGAEAGAERMSEATDPGRIARLAYTYHHMPIVAGIIVAAVANELVLAHPAGPSDLKTVLSVVGGMLLFLFGTILFKQAIHGRWQLSHLVGLGLLLLLAAASQLLSPLWLSGLATAIMVIVATWEALSLRSGFIAPAGI